MNVALIILFILFGLPFLLLLVSSSLLELIKYFGGKH